MRQAIGLLSLTALLSCSNGLGPANDLGGTWAWSSLYPGSHIVLNVGQSAGDLTGDGSFAMEAGPAGTLQLNGTYDRPHIALILHYDVGMNLTYTGTVSPDGFRMNGVLADSLGNKSPLTFTRR